MSERNIAALLREDAKTVQVQFGTTGKLYTYITHLDVQMGDWVAVPPNEQNSFGTVARVTNVDKEVLIEPQSPIQYKWLVDVVDMPAYAVNGARNTAIEDAVGEAYRANLRKSFQRSVLDGLEPKARKKLSSLLAVDL